MTVLTVKLVPGGGMIIGQSDPILITGSNGFIGARVVESLLHSGFCNLRCFVRQSSNLARLNAILGAAPEHGRKSFRGICYQEMTAIEPPEMWQ